MLDYAEIEEKLSQNMAELKDVESKKKETEEEYENLHRQYEKI